MKKKKHHHKHRNKNKLRRNAGPVAAAHPRPRALRLPKRAPAPPWQTIAAAVAGGAGGAAIGGLMVNQKILSPEAVGIGLMLGGGATAYFADGTARVVGTSVAAAGAGQLALTTMAKQALKGQQQHQSAIASAAPSSQPAQLPPAPPAVAPPRRSASGGGVVVDLFRDAVTDLDMIDDEWRYGTRDHSGFAQEPAEPVVIDLDAAA